MTQADVDQVGSSGGLNRLGHSGLNGGALKRHVQILNPAACQCDHFRKKDL
jgi:hypothetical protein